jgi:hypothetical protein
VILSPTHRWVTNMRDICVFRFPEQATRERLEEHIATAILSAECIYGSAKVRISAAYNVLPGKPTCVIDTTTDVGQHIAQVFTGLVTRDLGEDAFSVTRRSSVADRAPSNGKEVCAACG